MTSDDLCPAGLMAVIVNVYVLDSNPFIGRGNVGPGPPE